MHPLEKFTFCPVCGSKRFAENNEKSKHCADCGFTYYQNPSAATAAFIMNSRGELLVERRKMEPAKGTLDLPGGFADTGETAEEAVAREVAEETGLAVKAARYLFSQTNVYRYSDLDIQTLDLFFACEVEDTAQLAAGDDAAECMWIAPEDIHTELFGLRSIRHGLQRWLDR